MLKTVAGSKTIVQHEKLVFDDLSETGLVQRVIDLKMPVSARYDNISVFLDGKLLTIRSEHPSGDKILEKLGRDNMPVGDPLEVSQTFPFVNKIRLFLPGAGDTGARTDSVDILYHVFSGDWVDYSEIEKYATSILESTISTGDYGTQIKSYLESFINNKFSGVQDDIEDILEDYVDSLVPTAVTSEVAAQLTAVGIPGLVTAAVNTAKSSLKTELEAYLDSLVEDAEAVLASDLEDYIDLTVTDERTFVFESAADEIYVFIPAGYTKISGSGVWKHNGQASDVTVRWKTASATGWTALTSSPAAVSGSEPLVLSITDSGTPSTAVAGIRFSK